MDIPDICGNIDKWSFQARRESAGALRGKNIIEKVTCLSFLCILQEKSASGAC